MNTPLLELRAVDYAYRAEHPILQNVNLCLSAGERLALTGANGSGKTTLLHLIVGLCKPTRGQIIAFGKLRQTEADFWEVRIKAGLVFQDADDQLFCPTVAEDIAFGLFNLGKTTHEVERITQETLDILGISDYAGRITHHLSGGEKRLVALATVLAMQPDILLLDEPTTGLDEQAQARVVQILQGLPQAMLIVSHDRDFLQQLTGNVMRINPCST
ncbi:energy-coupling factor ABC transporter ATP-binding protein [Beggiatoa leptomitoformis]|uniref:ATP-binding cassette domain-containing protein n=1 Tax=Beggiatoa leptomitoformis TaxID=288004 RepID=A0A2N9YE99_9GAMM|nr:ABC transporter ATP-binding protein [Beggiatoa leptomitoformis]ALG68828.1 ATP-binding cassette domain-containing protein [Beggiatoa leptomitoformis]AUI68807.1 ATP-binding cassette domain-containing protein [Beggiatoa leptomitoformis]